MARMARWLRTLGAAAALLGAFGAPALGQDVITPVEANTASVEQLDALKGIGLKRAAALVDERQARGRYKDWLDLVDRLHGLGPARARKWSDAGLTVDGRPYDGPPPRPKARKPAR